MRVGDLIDHDVLDAEGRRVGVCTDVRLIVEPGTDPESPQLRLGGLLVSPRRAGSLLGYERGRTKGPWLVAAIVRRMHRGLVIVPWEDVAVLPVDGRPIVLRAGARRLRP